MKIRIWLIALIALSVGLIFPQAARADGIIIPEPPICLEPPCPPLPRPMEQLAIRYHSVEVTIEDQIATTHVDQVFHNPNEWQVEGDYLFPIPSEATVTSFTLWVDGKPVEGEVLEAGEARRTYEEIVRTLRDPALLEYADSGAMRARIFPIPPKGERRIELEYTQALRSENGLVRYIYPLNTEKFSIWPLEEVSVSVDIRSSVPIRAVYSPSHQVAISRISDNEVTAGYEEYGVKPDADFALLYSLGEEQAFHLLTYRDLADAQEDGFFTLLLAPRPEAETRIVPKDVIFVLDQSGSMEGEKFEQARQALDYVLGHLNSEDRFNVIAFSTGLETYAPEMQPASQSEDARSWAQQLSAVGSTDINRALLEAAAMASRERPTYLIFLTDGLPTEGVIERQKILDNLKAVDPDGLRLFAFGVGYDVDTILLDSLAQEHHGTSTYVLPGERLDEILSAFYSKISSPVLTDLSLDFGEVTAYDVYPSPLPDLFVGSQILVVGRYSQGGRTTVELTGLVNGDPHTFEYLNQQFVEDENQEAEVLEAIPRLWATRKIGHLLKQISLDGPNPEVIDQIVRLSIRYGIVTPYTSYLVTEESPLGEAEQARIVEEQALQMEAMPEAPAFGREAVEKAAGQGALSGADTPSRLGEEAEEMVKIVGSRTFVLTEGVWVDTAFDPAKMETLKVELFSEEYFKLIEARPALGSAFALGERVIAFSDGRAYEVVEAGTAVEPVPIPPTQTRQPSSSTIGDPNGDPDVSTTQESIDDISDPALTPDTAVCLGGWLVFVLLMFLGLSVGRRVFS